MVMKKVLQTLILAFLSLSAMAQADKVSISNNPDGMKLVVNGNDFFVIGMNWDYFPVGTNFSYSLWDQPDDIIRAALDSEMPMLKNMGVNTVRQYTGVPARWIQYIYEKYGIYTMLNHSFGRYGLTLNGAWVGNTEYADPRTRELLLAEVKAMTEEYKNTPGVLLFLLGNENNYGLFWEGAETEDIPVQDRKSTARATAMYKLFNEAAVAMKGIDKSHPVAMCNGDLLFLEIIAKECKDVDIFGTNMYRGISFGDAFKRVKAELNKPILFTEFGADAFNARDNEEDQQAQAFFMTGNWKEIYANAAGLGNAGNSLGGFTFQFSDGWWKYGQTSNLNIHDDNASWSNGGYSSDYVKGENNMNEEWFGICAKGPTNERGLYQLYPRAAYYALKEAHSLNPLAKGTTLAAVESHFANIQPIDAVIKARGDKAALASEQTKKIRMSELRADLYTFNTGGNLITTPKDPVPGRINYPDQTGFDHMQSVFIGVEAKPSENFRANVSFNILGNVAENPINEIFYENRGRIRTVQSFNVGNNSNSSLELSDTERLKIYRADISWNAKQFDLKGFYRTGHYHWGYEGDFFGFYPEANYGPNIDIYNGDAPFGFELSGKKSFKHIKLAFGPQLWWGANPAILAKYSRQIGKFDVTGIFHEDLDTQAPAVSSFAVPIPPTRRAALHVKRKFGVLGVELGGIWSNSNRVGEVFQVTRETTEGRTEVLQDETRMSDTWGGKVKMTYASGPFQWYVQGAAHGILAQGGTDYTKTFTGWRLKDSGSGNQMNILTGFTLGFGDLQIAPNFLWQRPIEDPMPANLPAPGRPRNILDDPFAVRANRETVAGEILFTYDPTPGTWMYEWNNDMAEDARFAVSSGFVYRHLPTTQDAAIGILGDGRTIFAFPGAAPAHDLWEAYARVVSKLNPDFGFITNVFAGTAQANGSDARLIKRFGGDVRMIYKNVKLTGMAKVNDWGPFDYHRDFNLTFPLQIMADVSTTLAKPSWFELPNSRLGLRYTWRSLDRYSPRYSPTTKIDDRGQVVPDPTAIGFGNGSEWEIQTYLQINITN
jgi:Glycosyl hydrolases family 2, TIM barrel domain